ncbi:ABC transporter ATP-binding protein [Pseudoroseicyclus tamaricis]|uniref:sn-glycerol-3-phosphate ABC transporter ATP-binding protein UgpC n=1 Tax=Pseudoroseicyclus tamaricis TaxID=2705421 RepID=A0A6B2JIJ6_9RHOB|nr:sn-glycerol-3-phosphate ABC transporter ATP-binding protein UgpC [Pseudoroseicyclus tamaricis]NDV01201.1 sn-glycerol-3-phosphate ABC transporter ATP-binding protein UgpC [Pseudoroseicyclus tamaricis]
MSELVLDGISKSFGDTEVVHGIDLTVAENEFVVLVGPSGCGKSTTLRMVAGLEAISSGELRIGGERVNDRSPGERDVAMVFQNYALYPHMSVAQNIAFGLRRRKLSRAERDAAVLEVAKLLEIEPLLDRRPRALSGGQRQRVAMGRAIIRDPQVFLFDEPLSNLDARLRLQMRLEIKRLHARKPVTTLYVTHDQTEAMTMADRVVVMNEGRIEQAGPPMEIYRNPRTRFVAEFIGAPAVNLFDARLTGGSDDGLWIELADGTRLSVPASRRAGCESYAGQPVVFGLRPEDIVIEAGDGPVAPVQMVETMGAETLAYLGFGGTEACARLTGDSVPSRGDQVHLRLGLERMILIDPTTDRVIGAA